MLTAVACVLVVFSAIGIEFKVFICTLLVLENLRQRYLERKNNPINAIEIRGEAVLIKRKADAALQAVEHFKLKQNRVFAEIELQLNDEIRTEFFYKDRFISKQQFCELLQNLRSIQSKKYAHTNPNL